MIFNGNPPQNLFALVYIGWLYLVQGIPYGLQDKFIPLQLKSSGLSYSSVSSMRVLLVPWATKGLWAPIVEVWGGKHRWLLISVMALSVTAFAGSHISVENSISIGCMLLSFNLFAAVQDISVDGIILQVLPDEQLALGNTIEMVLSKAGSLLGGAGFTYLVSFIDWSMAFISLAIIYLLTAIWVPNGPIKEDECLDDSCPQQILNDENNGKDSTHTSRVMEALCIFRNVINAPGTIWLSIYISLYKMGERGSINNMPLFLFDKGISQNRLAFWNGFVAQCLSVAGSFYGGVILSSKHRNAYDVLILHCMYRTFCILLQFVVIFLWESNVFRECDQSILHAVGIFSLCSVSYISGIITTASVTLMMQVSRRCEKKTQASHYSLMASVEVAGRLLFATIAGFIIDCVGMELSFLLFTILSLLPIFILNCVPSTIVHSKNE